MGLNILVIDDSSTMRLIVKKMLKMSGLTMHTYHEAANGHKGLEILDQVQIDLLFIDLNMPVMNGLEMIKLLRRNPQWKKLPAIVISTESSQTRIQKLRSQGIVFLPKPFSPEQFRKTVQEVVRRINHA